ncbi:hypothetical protein Vretimale_17861, partial [Volvox reticuliferus]
MRIPNSGCHVVRLVLLRVPQRIDEGVEGERSVRSTTCHNTLRPLGWLRRWKEDPSHHHRLSRGEAGAAARAPEDRRRSGRGTVGSQYDLPQHIAPAGMVETMERGPQPPPPPQQTHGNRVGDSTMVAAAVLESMRNWQEMDNMQQAGTEDPDCCNDRHLHGAICMNGGASCVQ